MTQREPQHTREEVVVTSRVLEDRQRRRQTLAQARSWLLHLGALVRQLAVHDPHNTSVVQALGQLYADLQALQGGGMHATTFVFAEGHAFADGVWIRCTGRAWETSESLTQSLQVMHARGIIFEAGLGQAGMLAAAQQLRSALRPNQSYPKGFDPQIPGVRLIAEKDEDESENDRAAFRRMALDLVRDGLQAADGDALKRLDIYTRRRQRALVLRLVQIAEETPEDLLTLTSLRDPSMPPAAHSLMVCVLCICLGRLMDLRRRDLLRVGIAALNHNVGHSLVPPAVFSVPRAATAQERAVIEEHPLAGARYLLEQYGFEPAIVERAVASAEHHRGANGGGYPKLVAHVAHPFAHLIAVCDVFDALTRPRPQRAAYPPDQAVKLVRREAGTRLDPLVVRTLLRLLGKFPPGSLVELDTGEYAVVVGPGRGRHPLTRPRVLLLTDDEGYEIEPFIVVDLGERHPRRRAWLRTIVRTRDPARMTAPVSQYLFADRLEKPVERLDSDDPTLAGRSADA